MAKKDVEVMDAEIVREDSEVMVPEEVEKIEDRTLIWFFVVVGFVFACVLVPYFWVESSKAFEFGGVDFVIEDYENLRIFHGRFVSLTNPNLNYNVFFRTDPRTNDAEVVGKLDDFWNYQAISWSPEVEACRGDLSRAMLDLSAFLKQGVGARVIESGFTDEEIANASGKDFLTCANAVERTIVIIDIGERRIVQDETNPSCYTIYAEDCEDSAIVEKFMVKSVIDFRDSYPTTESEE